MGRSNMAVGKNKGLKIGGKKGAKKKIVDPFTRKDWYDIKAPSVFKVRQVGKTLVNRTAGTKIASDGLKGRVYEVSLADLQIDLRRCPGQKLFDQFSRHGLDHRQAQVHGQEMGNLDVKTTDGYTLRVF